MRKTVAAFAILVGASAARPASAEADALPLSLAWDAPHGCPNDAFIARRVGQILHGTRSTTAVVARGTVARLADGRFSLTLALRTADVEDTKTIAATSCAALAEAAAVVLAMAIAPAGEASSEASEPPPPPAPKVEPPDATEASTASAEPKATPQAKRAPKLAPRVAVGLGGSMASGILPEVGGGAVVTLALRLERFRFGLLGTFSLGQNPIFNEPAGASFDMIETGAFGGYLLPIGRFSIGPCANVEMTYVRVRGFGIREPQTSTTLWPTAVIGARAETLLTSWLGLFARADVVVPLDPPTFTLVTSASSVHLHEPDVLGPRLSLGAEIVFP